MKVISLKQRTRGLVLIKAIKSMYHLRNKIKNFICFSYQSIERQGPTDFIYTPNL